MNQKNCLIVFFVFLAFSCGQESPVNNDADTVEDADGDSDSHDADVQQDGDTEDSDVDVDDGGFIPGDERCEITGTTYYIDAESGDDSNDGSSGSPWQTPDRALQTLEPGDGVLIRSGNYGAFTHDGSTRSDYITFKADEGHTPVFTEITVNNSDPADAYLRFCGLTVQHPEPETWPEDNGLRQSLGSLAWVNRAHYVEFLYCTFRGINKYLSGGLDVDDSNYMTVHHCEISIVRGGIHAVNSDSMTFSYNYVHDMSEGSAIRFQHGASNFDTEGTLIEGNHIHSVRGDPDDPYFPHDDPNEWHYGSGISLRIYNATIRNNIIHDGRHLGQSMMFYQDEASTPFRYRNMLVENNLFYDSNVIRLFGVSDNVVIRNNTFISEIDVDGTGKYDILQRYNRGAYFLISSFADDASDTPIEIYNNIFVGRWAMGSEHLIEDHNIFWLRETGGDYHENGLGEHTIFGVWRDNTEPYDLRGNPNFFEDIGFTGTTPEYSFAKDGVQAFFVDPGFYFGSEGEHRESGQLWDYHLAEGSPAINFGNPDHQPSDSLGSLGADGFIRPDGPARDSEHHSAGCYEFPH